jgi:3-hydroxyisobutyrate dehydrogenase-like beta-hydroxyacid dehydrogenase
VALLGSVPLRGLRTPALASGSGAAAFAELFRPFGMPVEVVEGGAGAAATRKLVRSVFMKGLAAAALESVRAAEAAGCEEWLRGEIAGVLDGPGEPLLERLLAGSRLHAERRMLEMEGAADLLRDLGVEPRVAAASVGWLEELGAENDR